MSEARPVRALDVIQVSDPCPEPWDRMRGDDKVRFCGVCEKHVYHLSAMTRAEADALLTDTEGRLCVRFYRRLDGTVSTIDCGPVRFAAMRKLARRTLAGAAAMVVSVLGLVFSLSFFRLLGFDISTWFESSPVAAIAKAMKPIFEPEIMGEEVYVPPPSEEARHHLDDIVQGGAFE
ncbi:MAG: hypothetical protein KC619_19850 [Myxococcales bacterium]|nr:hypothetical protein [Myxococcales bacterium]